MSQTTEIRIQPQLGYQMDFCSSPADVVIGGGAAFGGKSYGLLMDAARGVLSVDGKPKYPGYGAVIFRKTYPEITMVGGLWDESTKIYHHVGGKPNETSHSWYFQDSESEIAFKNLEHERDLPANKGQFAYIGFDEMTDFSQKMFTFMMSRNRTVCGMRPKMRGTCNPDPDSWLAGFLEWWIDQETGFPYPDRSGKIRYFTVDENQFVWGATRQEVWDKAKHIFLKPEFEEFTPRDLIKSATFVIGNWKDNAIGVKANPAYLANLNAQSEEEKLRLLYGNWKIRVDGASLFDWERLESMFTNVIPVSPRDEYYMTIDHASTGQDLCVIGVWHGWRLIRCDIIPKPKDDKWRFDVIMHVIRFLRATYRPLPVDNMIVDQDGVGIRDVLKCNIFQGHLPPTERIQPPADRRQGYNEHLTPKQYKNKKIQCTYQTAEKVNKALMSIDLENFYMWEDNTPHKITNGLFKQRGKTYELRRRIKDEFRTMKREKQDYEGRKEITPKDKQKNALGGLSPDIFDMINQRSEFEFMPKRAYLR